MQDVSKTSFPGFSTELCGFWIGISENIGPIMTFKILTDEMGEVVCHFLVCPAENPDTTNLRKDPVINPVPVDPVSHVKGEPESSVNPPPAPHHYPTRSFSHLLNDSVTNNNRVPPLTGQSLLPEP